MPLRRCRRCRRYHDVGAACPSAPKRHPHYQSPEWDAARKAVEGKPCAIPQCPTPHRRVTAHHLIPRDDGGPDREWNLLPLCGSHHSAYEASRRHGRTTAVTRVVDAAREIAERYRAFL